MKRNILVTGGAGFLGSHLCDRFLAEGAAGALYVLDDHRDGCPECEHGGEE